MRQVGRHSIPETVHERSIAYERMLKRDPDGWEHQEPTMQDHLNFKQWAIDNFGWDMWDRYWNGPAWDTDVGI